MHYNIDVLPFKGTYSYNNKKRVILLHKPRCFEKGPTNMEITII